MSRTIKERLLIGLSVPYISRTGGFADRAIGNFHNTFGLKNFSRGNEPRNRALIQFTSKDGESRRIEGSSSGIGDLVLYGSYLLRKGDKDRSALSTQISLSLPTGDEDQLEGTGEVGILGEFSEGVYEVALGGKWRMGIHSLIELAIVLNVINFRNSADLGAHLNWSTFF